MTTTPDAPALKAAVRLSVDQVQAAFASNPMRVVPDGQGGAWVQIEDVELGSGYVPASSFVVALLPFNLPGVDIYPMFLRADLVRVDGSAHGPPFQVTNLSWPGDADARPVMQVSRRTRGDFAAQTPAQKICKVLQWVRDQ